MPVLAALKKAEQRRRNRDELDSSDDDMQQQQQKKPKNSADMKALLKDKKKNNKMMSEADISSEEEEDDEELFEDEEELEEEEEMEEGEEKENDEDEDEDEEEKAPKQTAEVKFVEPNNWVERMSLVALKPLPDDIDPEDDPRREEAFVQHALLSVQRGVEMLERAKVPWRRPDDYFAEMYKSDVHMDKIRRAIESTKTAVQERMKRRMIKEQKQYGKQVQADVLRQRAQDKRAMMAKIQEVRKKKGRNNDDRGSKLDELFNEDDDEGGRGRGGQQGGDRKARHSARGAAFRGKANITRPGGAAGKRGGGGGGRGGGGGGRGGRGGGGRPGKSKRR